MLGVKTGEIRFEHYSNLWQKLFNDEKKRLMAISTDNLIDIHHVGSTSISGALAKPIIDIAIEVNDINKLDKKAIEDIGYISVDEDDIEGRYYFIKQVADGVSTHHLNCLEKGDPLLASLITFRDYLNRHPKYVNKYNKLKSDLQHEGNHGPSYDERKSGFIDEVVAVANGARPKI